MRDIRQIFFNKSDVLAAIIYFRQRNGIQFPTARQTDVRFSTSDGLVNTTIVLRDFESDSRSMSVDALEMMATLLQHCFYKGRSLPKDGDRSLDVIGDELVLTIRSRTEA